MKLIRILSIALVAALLSTLGYVSHAQTPMIKECFSRTSVCKCGIHEIR
jgi:hypothetical protein